MNYEKKYKEALERAKSFKTPELCDVAEYIFPELKESEDEKTRKELITHCRNTRCVTEEGAERIAKWIDWLEKQGEQKPTNKNEPKFKVGDRITKSSKKSCPVHSSIDDTICEVAEVHDTYYILNTKEGRIQEPFEWQDYYELVEPAWSEEDERIRQRFIKLVKMSSEVEGFALHKWEADEMLAWLEKQGESYTKKDVDDAYVEGMAFAKDELEKQSEQKSDWSEEDEKMVVNLVDYFKVDDALQYTEKQVVDWLKSLKNRVLPQPKQEWSEEDQNALEDVREAVVHYWGGDLQDILLCWLKSIKLKIKGE